MPLKLTRNFALLYGIMLGDGCLSLGCRKKKTIVIVGSMQDDILFFEKVVKPVIGGLIEKDIPIRFRKLIGTICLHFVKNSLFDFIHSFGYPIGKKGNLLFIPPAFYEKNFVRYVVRGFFATDGSLVITNNNGTIYPRVEANGIAKSLLIEISKFLNFKGINCKFYKAKRKYHHYPHTQQQYRLQINGKDNLKKFIRVIGFVNPKQIEKLSKFYGCTKS